MGPFHGSHPAEEVIHDAGATGVGEELRAEPDDPSCRDQELSRTRPLPWFTMRVILARRALSFSMTIPWYSSATSMTSSSIGSSVRPRSLAGHDPGTADL